MTVLIHTDKPESCIHCTFYSKYDEKLFRCHAMPKREGWFAPHLECLYFLPSWCPLIEVKAGTVHDAIMGEVTVWVEVAAS